MNYFLIVALLVGGFSSAPEKSWPYPAKQIVDRNSNELRNINGTWFYCEEKFNGYIIEEESGKLISKLQIANGKEDGVALGWFSNGKKRYQRGFMKGNREGLHRGWYENGTLAFEFFFHNDLYEGEQKQYFKNGILWQSLNYKNGYEEGKQKSWNESGRLINNFTVKNKKLYGVIGRYDCMSVNKNM